MNLLGLVDAENVPVAVLHYSIPAVILLYFIGTSSVPSTPPAPVTNHISDGASGSTSTSSPPPVLRSQPSHSNILKWLFVLAIFTFVYVILANG